MIQDKELLEYKTSHKGNGKAPDLPMDTTKIMSMDSRIVDRGKMKNTQSKQNKVKTSKDDLDSKELDNKLLINSLQHSKDSFAKKFALNSKLLRAAELGSIEEIKSCLNPTNNEGFIADINAKELNDFTPLHNAVVEGHIKIVKYLLKQGANIDPVTNGGKTPLHMACYNRNKEIIEYLIYKRANINAQDIEGNTPMHILAELGFIELVIFLLKLEPDISIKNNYGQTAAEVSSNLQIRKILKSLLNNTSSGYNRITIGNMVLRNNRVDSVKLIIYKVQLIEKEILLNSKEEAKVKIKKPKNAKDRRRKIIEAALKMKDLILEPRNKGVGLKDFMPVGRLGKGSFGQVYLVEHKSSGKYYAMKIIEKRKYKSHKSLKYPMAERNIMINTNHPFIVKLHYAFQTEKRLYLLLDYCPGYTLI